MKLKVERFVPGGEFFQGLFEGIADVFWRAHEIGGEFVLLQVAFVVGCGPRIKVAEAEMGEDPLAVFFRGEAGGMVTLARAADVDVEAGVFGHGLFYPVPSDVELSDVGCRVTILCVRAAARVIRLKETYFIMTRCHKKA